MKRMLILCALGLCAAALKWMGESCIAPYAQRIHARRDKACIPC